VFNHNVQEGWAPSKIPGRYFQKWNF